MCILIFIKVDIYKVKRYISINCVRGGGVAWRTIYNKPRGGDISKINLTTEGQTDGHIDRKKYREVVPT